MPVVSSLRTFSGWSSGTWLRANIIVGASLFHRAAARGVFLAAWLTGRADKSEVSKVHFASTPAEPAELVVQLRGRHGGKVA
ncbi:MAG TPA: hypothetical protein VEY88_04315 [Archangium sp.]|nr:hypothetical protein [Archangium sp.]